MLLVSLPPLFPADDRPTHHPIHLCYAASLPHSTQRATPFDAHFHCQKLDDLLSVVFSFSPHILIFFQEDHRRWIPRETTTYILHTLRRRGFRGLIGVAGTTDGTNLNAFAAEGADFIIPEQPEQAVDWLAKEKIASPQALSSSRDSEGRLLLPSSTENSDVAILPRWDLLPHDRYPVPPFRIRQKPYFPVLSAVGCPYTCAFCPASKTGIRQRSVASVMAEIEHLKAWFGVREIYFADATFGVNRDWLEEFCHAFSRRFPEVRWSCSTRIDLVDEETLRWMKKSGCYGILFGLESFSDELLRRWRKGFSSEQAERTVKLAKKMGFEVTGTFLFGAEGDSPDRAYETIRWAMGLPLDFAIFSVMTLLDQRSKEAALHIQEEAYNNDYLFKGKINVPPSYGSPAELFKMQRLAYWRFYLQPRTAARMLQKMWRFSHPARLQSFLFFFSQWALKGINQTHD